jgi:formylmethanofuran dehydrogenase subunit E-like metal-binding protein
VLTRLEFTEVDEQGKAIGPAKQFEVIGDMVYVDYLHITFDDQYTEQADLERGTSLALFQRIFGEHQAPIEGFQLDTVGARPTAYAHGVQMSDFEKKIWTDFWLIANDPQKAAEMGINSAQGSAVSMRVQKGKTYELDLRSTGEMRFKPVDLPPQQLLNPPVKSNTT